MARGPAGSPLEIPETLVANAVSEGKSFEAELKHIDAVLGKARKEALVGKLFIKMRPQSLATPGCATALGELARKRGFQRSDIVVELTDPRSISDQRAFGAILQTFRDQGFGLSLDGFGRGLANLDLVQHLPLDYLRLDGFFCRSIEGDARKLGIVRSTVEMARALGISVIADPLESESESEIVRSLGVAFAQGRCVFHEASGAESAESPSSRRVPEGKEVVPGSLRVSPVQRDLDRADHEISNLLTAIALYSAQNMKKMEKDDPLYEDMSKILAASERAIQLKLA